MKKEFTDIINFIKKDKFNLMTLILSLVIFLISCYALNFLIALLILIIINLIWIVPYIQRRIKINQRKKLRNETKDDLERSETMATRKRPTSKKVNSKRKKGLKKKILLGCLIAFLAFIVIGILFLFYVAITAPKFNPNKLYSKEASALYDTDGEVYAKLGSEMRQKISYDDMSEELVNAIVATEDSRFFQHNGFDLPRFLKASVGQALHRNAGGASTLTMQVSKNQFTSTTSRGFEGIKRKFTDIYLSMFQIEKNYTKEQIIEFYANSYYLGSGAYGVEQASQTYFKKHAKDLNLSEAAMIAGMFQSPVTYDPNLYPEYTENRRQLVLKLMKRHGYITDAEYNIAKKMTVDKIVIKGGSAKTNYADYQGFVDSVAAEVQKKTGYDPYSYSMKIYTTMDRKKQDKVTNIMNGKDYKWENDQVEAGVVAIDTKTGAITAVGSGRKRDGAKQLNNATMIKRQIGSTAKPLFDYGPAIEYNNWNTYHPIIDAQYSYSDGTPINNWDGGYKGIITIREALIDSRNIPALKTFQSVKNSDIKTFVTNLGLSPEDTGGSKLHEAHAIGGYTGESPLTVAAAYNAFANNGVYIEPYSFTKIEFDENGKTYENEPKKTKVMSPETAYMVSDMLIDTGKNALGRYNNINGAEFGAKTGTTNFDEKTLKARGLPSSAVNDLWVAGISPDYSIAVWYGYEKNSNKYYNRFGSSQNSRLFQAVAKNFFKSGSKFTKPSGVSEVTVEKNCGYPLLPSANTPDDMKTTELFKESSKPTEVSARFNTLSNVSDLKATVKGNKATITWKAIATPEGLSDSYWGGFVNKLFTVSSDRNTYLSYLMNFNKSRLGSVVYNVYEKTGSGLKLATTVSTTSATVRLSSSSPKFVVKASYSNFKGAESSGVEVSVSYNGGSSSDITATLNGKSTINLKVGETYNDEGVSVSLDGEDLTNSSDVTINTTVQDASKNIVNLSSIGNSAGVYTITYKVSYFGDHVANVTRTIVVS